MLNKSTINQSKLIIPIINLFLVAILIIGQTGFVLAETEGEDLPTGQEQTATETDADPTETETEPADEADDPAEDIADEESQDPAEDEPAGDEPVVLGTEDTADSGQDPAEEEDQTDEGDETTADETEAADEPAEEEPAEEDDQPARVQGEDILIVIPPAEENIDGEAAEESDAEPQATDGETDSPEADDNESNPGTTGGSQPAQINLDMRGGNHTSAPILAGWTMAADKDENESYLGSDGDSLAGSQFLPSGEFKVSRKIAVCAAVADNQDLAGVYVDINYPADVAVSLDDQLTGECGYPFSSHLSLTAMPKNEAFSLVCEQIKNNNNNLITFDPGSDYSQLCSTANGLASGQIKVYCALEELAYSDPAGDYIVEAYSESLSGYSGSILENQFEYLELTAFKVDFENISYGAVQVDVLKTIRGDEVWQADPGDNPASVSNVGNTRLKIVVEQNDFGLGKTDGAWNVQYQARLGSSSEMTIYSPDTPTTLKTVLELAETTNLDFGIKVFNFPTENVADYSGDMTLDAVKAEALTCAAQ